jgi:hypothetical protein
MQTSVRLYTPANKGLYDINRQEVAFAAESGLPNVLVNVCVRGATAGVMIFFILMYRFYMIKKVLRHVDNGVETD